MIGVFAVLPAKELPKAARVNDRHDVDLNHLFTKSACHGAPVLGGNCCIDLVKYMSISLFYCISFLYPVNGMAQNWDSAALSPALRHPRAATSHSNRQSARRVARGTAT